MTGATALIVLWSEGSSFEPMVASDGTTVVSGSRLKAWLGSLDSRALTPEQVEAVWRALDAQCAIRDATDDAFVDAPRSPGDWTQRLLLGFIAALAGLLASAWWASEIRNLWATLAGWLLLAVLGVGVARIRDARYLALGWLIGVVCTVVAVGMLAIRAVLAG